MHLTSGLHRSVQKHPDKTATVTGERRQTFRQLAQRVAQTAGALRALGLVNHNLSTAAQVRMRAGRAVFDVDWASYTAEDRATFSGGANKLWGSALLDCQRP